MEAILFKIINRYFKLFVCLNIILFCRCTDNYHNYDPNRLVVIDVGQGLSCLVQSQGDFWLLDAGGDSTLNWEKTLKQHHVKKLKGVLISHWHLDHYSGLTEIITAFPVDSLWYGPDNGYAYISKTLISTAQKQQIGTRKLQGPQNLQWNSLEAQVLWPQIHTNTAEGNPSSLVIRVGSPQHGWFLFTGDIGFAEEEQILIYNNSIESDILIVPHHGSGNSSSVAFVGAVNPFFAAISVGKNPWGLPRQEVLDRLQLVMG